MKSRRLRPRATDAIAVAPVTVTDRTCAQVLGLEPRPFREWLVSADVPHKRIGRRVVARVDDVLDALARAPAAEPRDDRENQDDEDGDDDVPGTPDEVLRRLGLRRTA